MAVKEAHAFKFADRAQLYFNCQIQIAVKEPNAQCPVIFTIIPCPEKILIDPRKKLTDPFMKGAKSLNAIACQLLIQ